MTISPLEVVDLFRVFESLDQNGDGLLSLDELNWLLTRTGVHASREELISLVGEDGLNFEDFSYFYESILGNNNRSGKQNIEEQEEEDGDLYRAFKVFDLDGDGLISSQELQIVLDKFGMWDKNGRLDCDRIIDKYDVNSDGFVDFDEFKRMMLAY